MADSPPPQLTALPDLPLQKIAEHAGFRGVVSMQKTCTRFRNLFKAHPPSIDHREIDIECSADEINVTYDGGLQVRYKNVANGCAVSSKYVQPLRMWMGNEHTNQKMFADEDYEEMFSKDFEKNLRLQTTCLGQFTFRAGNGRVFRKVLSVLKARAKALEVNCVRLRLIDMKDVELFLQQLPTEALKSIAICWRAPTLPTAEIAQLARLPQWKSADGIQMFLHEIPMDALHHFLHLKTLIILVDELRMEHIFHLKEMILHPNFEWLSLRFRTFPNGEALDTMMGPKHAVNDGDRVKYERRLWFFKSPHENVWIRVEQDRQQVLIETIRQDEIPHGAIVQPMFQLPDN